MRRFRTTIVLALATLLSISICSAQQTATTSVPNLIRYSGTLKDAQGAALSASTAVGVTFSIYKQQDGGASVWMETQNVTPESNGQYNVVLGSTTATGLPDDLFLQQEQRWLGVQVQGQAEQARVLLVSVPYAFKAHEAETLGGLPPSSFVKVPPSDAASSTSANAGSGTAGNKGTTAVVASQSNGSTVAQDGSWAREGTTVKLSNETDSVGIGTSTPKTKLDVAGSIHASGPISSGNSITLNGLTNSITADNVVPLGGQANHIYIGGDNYPNPPIPFSRIQVGIGTKSPTIIGINKLTLFDPGFPTLGISGGTIPANSGGVELTVATCPGCYSNFAIPGDAVLRVPGTTGAARNDLILTDRGAGGIRFGTGQACGGGLPCETEKMTLLHNGNFGIANNQPQTLFSVGPQAVGLHSPFEVDTNGDMVRIKKVAYSWPILPQPALNQVLTVVSTAGGVAGLGWMPPGGGGVTGNCALTPNYLTKWTGSTTVGCSFVWENPAGANQYFVGIGPSFQVGVPNPNRQLQVDGNIDVLLADGTQHYQITEQTVLSIDGIDNTFVGVGAGSSNAFNGRDNTFTGTGAGFTNFGGNYNAYYGSGAGGANANGYENTCIGKAACSNNLDGHYNTFLGAGAGLGNFHGSNNTFVGLSAGSSNSAGSNNIYVGSDNAGESNTIRIGGNIAGFGTQTNTYIQGIFGSSVVGHTAYTVCVGIDGHLYQAPSFTDCAISSRRFKEQIADMGDSSSKLFQLRPVTYFYKPQYDDGSHALQYGLIAEEVAKVYPEMAAYDKDGTPYTVRYQLLAPMLLNELQKQHRVVAAQQDELQTQLQQIKAQRQEIDGLKLQLQQENASLQERLTKLESYVATQMKTASDNPPRTTPGANGGLQ